MRYLLQSLRMRNRNWSRNLSIILALGTWWCESIRALIRYNVRSRHTHTRIYFRWCDMARSHCSIRYDKMRSDEIVQIEFPIGSRSDPIITRPRLVTLVYVQIRSYITLRYVYQKPICSATMGHGMMAIHFTIKMEGCSQFKQQFFDNQKLFRLLAITTATIILYG